MHLSHPSLWKNYIYKPSKFRSRYRTRALDAWLREVCSRFPELSSGQKHELRVFLNIIPKGGIALEGASLLSCCLVVLLAFVMMSCYSFQEYEGNSIC